MLRTAQPAAESIAANVSDAKEKAEPPQAAQLESNSGKSSEMAAKEEK
jgi:hypothetical protein